MSRQHHAVWGLALAFIARGALAVEPPPSTSLNNCQKALRTATKQFVTKEVVAIGNCLQAVSTQIVQNNAATANGAAATCVTQFRKLNDSRGLKKQLSDKLATAIAKKCDPQAANVSHTLADILGSGAGVPQPLNAQNLNSWCIFYGGDGSIDSLQEWVDCITAASECAVDSTIASQYPRVLQWLNAVRPWMLGRTPPGNDKHKIDDALAGLDAVQAEIDGSDKDNVVSIQCGPPPSQPLQTGQTDEFGTGSDGNLQKGQTRLYTDNGNGTITDRKTGLIWEKKDQSGGIHDWSNSYTWGMSTPPFTMNGTMVTDFLATLNAGSGFAGHTDWRIPNQNELLTLVNYENTDPAVDAAFDTSCTPNCTVDGAAGTTKCSCTQSNGYWSSTTYLTSPAYSWFVSFSDGADFGGGCFAVNSIKSTFGYVRAVRGG